MDDEFCHKSLSGRFLRPRSPLLLLSAPRKMPPLLGDGRLPTPFLHPGTPIRLLYAAGFIDVQEEITLQAENHFKFHSTVLARRNLLSIFHHRSFLFTCCPVVGVSLQSTKSAFQSLTTDASQTFYLGLNFFFLIVICGTILSFSLSLLCAHHALEASTIYSQRSSLKHFSKYKDTSKSAQKMELRLFYLGARKPQINPYFFHNIHFL